MARHIFADAHDWLLTKAREHAAANNSAELLSLLVSLLSGDVDNDTIQDVFQGDMDRDGFFVDLETVPIDEADPSNWPVADCIWFLDARLGIDTNTIDRDNLQGTDEQDAWRNYVAARIDDYEEPECEHPNATLTDGDEPATYHCPDCGEDFIGEDTSE